MSLWFALFRFGPSVSFILNECHNVSDIVCVNRGLGYVSLLTVGRYKIVPGINKNVLLTLETSTT